MCEFRVVFTLKNFSLSLFVLSVELPSGGTAGCSPVTDVLDYTVLLVHHSLCILIEPVTHHSPVMPKQGSEGTAFASFSLNTVKEDCVEVR